MENKKGNETSFEKNQDHLFGCPFDDEIQNVPKIFQYILEPRGKNLGWFFNQK